MNSTFKYMLGPVLFLWLMITGTFLFSQTSIFYPNADIRPDSFYYSNTDFSKIDTLSFWRFRITEDDGFAKFDFSKPLAKIEFWRAKELCNYIDFKDRFDSTLMRVDAKNWKPRISFYVFPYQDVAMFLLHSSKTRVISSCWPPDVGGDIVIVGNLILLNNDVCMDCGRFKDKRDFCRPVLNYVFNEFDRDSIQNLEQLSRELCQLLGEESAGWRKPFCK